MSNPMKYIKVLEAAGFDRSQAEAQVQVMMEAMESDLLTRSEFKIFEQSLANRFSDIDHRFENIDYRFKELELRLVVRLGLINVSTVSIAVAVLAWLIKIH